MKTIGIKLADGTFYPVLEEGTPKKRMLDLTTAKDNQTKVQIDLYRSETGSMSDAEYVDTLEVTKLVPHPNGEPELHLSLGLDENNNLTAEVVDPETGKKSETEVNLVSKTVAEKASPADFAPSIKSPDSKSESNPDSKNEADGISSNEIANDSQPEDFSFDDLADDTLAAEEENDSTLAPEDLPEIKSDALEDMPFSFDNSEVFPSESSKKAETPVESAPVDELGIADNTLEGIDFSSNSDDKDDNDTLSAETVPDTNENDATVADTTTSDFDLSDFDDNEFGSSETSVEPPSDSDGIVSQNPDDAATENATGIDFADLPDFDDNEFSSDKKTTTDDDIESAFDTSALDDFDTSDLDASLDKIASSSDSENENPGYTKGSAMDFSDLYDKETLNGEHASLYDDDEDEKKKTKVPVIICIICAIICIIATILILFVVPSKYNLIKSRNTRNSEYIEKNQKTESTKNTENSSSSAISDSGKNDKDSLKSDDKSPVQINVTQKQNEPAEIASDSTQQNAAEPKQEEKPAPKAEENKIVVAPEPEKVVPEPAPKAEKKPDVKYHIRWGDTLWDLSESYYKTPWKYPKIANYNHIKNPDVIISGTDILIPAE